MSRKSGYRFSEQDMRQRKILERIPIAHGRRRRSSKLGQYDSSSALSESDVRGHFKLALSMPARPGYQHRLPSMLRQDQYPVRSAGGSALHSTALYAAVPSAVSIMIKAMA